MNSRTKVLHLREDAANFVTKVVQPFTGRCPGAGGSTWNLDGGRKTAQTLCAMVGASEHLRGQDHRRSEAKRHFPAEKLLRAKECWRGCGMSTSRPRTCQGLQALESRRDHHVGDPGDPEADRRRPGRGGYRRMGTQRDPAHPRRDRGGEVGLDHMWL